MSKFIIVKSAHERQMETFGQRLKRIRKEKKLTQVKLGNKMGIEPHAICGYEVGKMLPSLPTLEWLCKALDVTATELLGF